MCAGRVIVALAMCTAVQASQLRRAVGQAGDICKGWCVSSTSGWDTLCSKQNCTGCPECTVDENACSSWCTTSTKTWPNLCEKENCAGCEECSVVAAGCRGWCATSTKTWAQLCRTDSCTGCSDCASTTTTNGYPGCKGWCRESTNAWSKICTKDNCAQCPECDTTTTSPTTTTTTTTTTADLCVTADMALRDMASRSDMEAAGWTLTTAPNHDSFEDGGYQGWKAWESLGALSATMQGEGTMTFTLSNPHDWAVSTNYVTVYKNVDVLSTVGQMESAKVEVDFVPGDVIKIEESYAIIRIRDFQIVCS